MTEKRWFFSLFCVLLSLTIQASGFVPVAPPADLDGDGRDDLFFFDEGLSLWRAYNIDGKRVLSDLEFGAPGAQPLVGRFLKNGRVTVAYYRALAGEWVILVSSPNADEQETQTISVARQGVPVVADFTGDGKDELALFDPNERVWTAWSVQGEVVFENFAFGRPEQQWAAADLTGNGRAELAAYDDATGTWQWVAPVRGSDLEPETRKWAARQGRILLRDFNGNGRADLALWEYNGVLRVMDAVSGRPIQTGPLFGDEYAIPVHGHYEGKDAVNLSYVSMGHMTWHVRKSDGEVVTPNLGR